MNQKLETVMRRSFADVARARAEAPRPQSHRGVHAGRRARGRGDAAPGTLRLKSRRRAAKAAGERGRCQGTRGARSGSGRLSEDSAGPTTSSSTSGTRSRRPTTTRTRSGSRSWPTAAWRPGQRDRASYVLQQGRSRLVLTAPARAGRADRRPRRARHGDGVRDIALDVEDVDRAWEGTTKRGARSIQEPHDVTDEHGVGAPRGDRHLRRHDPLLHRPLEIQGRFPAPGYRATGARSEPAGRFSTSDHMVGTCRSGT